MLPPIHHHGFQVGAHEAVIRGTVGLTCLLNGLQQAAAVHAGLLNFNGELLWEKGMTWVLARLVVAIERFPEANEQLTVVTWPHALNRAFFDRQSEIRDSEGQVLLRAGSYWVLIDMEQRKAITPDPELVADLPRTPRSVLSAPRRTLRWARDFNFPHEATILPRLSDLDSNGHVNNANLASWIFESLPETCQNLHQLKQLDIAFRNECLYGTAVTSRGSIKDDEGLHLLETEDAQEILRASTRWDFDQS